MNAQVLTDVATMLVADDKGLLAMDESNGTCNKRFATVGILQTEQARRAYRELIVTTPGNVALFSHGEFGRVLPARWIGATAVEGRHFALDTAFLSILGYEPSHPETPVIALFHAS